ncbi:MAG: MCE family protein [bacterium]
MIGLLPALLACSETPFAVAVTFPEAAGLKPGDNVAMRGLAIGQVRDVDLATSGVVVRIEVEPRFAHHLDSKATFQIEEEKLVTGKRRIAVLPGDPPGVPLAAGATVAGAALPEDMIDRARGALKDSVQDAESALKHSVDHARDQVEGLGRAVLGPDTQAPRTRGDTVDLDQPRHYRVRVLGVKVHATTADGKDWDTMGDPELMVQVWVDERQVLLADGGSALAVEFEDAVSEAFDLTDKTRVQVKVFDKDATLNDEIGVAELTPTPADAAGKRVFRLAAGRIEEVRVAVEEVKP